MILDVVKKLKLEKGIYLKGKANIKREKDKRRKRRKGPSVAEISSDTNFKKIIKSKVSNNFLSFLNKIQNLN